MLFEAERVRIPIRTKNNIRCAHISVRLAEGKVSQHMRHLLVNDSVLLDGPCRLRKLLEKAFVLTLFGVLFAATSAVNAGAQDENGKFVLARENRTIVLEPYGPGIVRVTMSSSQQAALGAPGYGIVGTPSMTGWTHAQGF